VPLFSKLNLGWLMCLLPALGSRGKDKVGSGTSVSSVLLSEELCRADQTIRRAYIMLLVCRSMTELNRHSVTSRETESPIC